MGVGRDLVYGASLALTSPVWMPVALARGAHRGGWRDRFGDVGPLPPPTRPRILVHAVSVGEVASIASLVPALRRADLDVVVSSTTDTGMARARKQFEEASPVVRFPWDWSRSVERFFDQVRPDLVALVELEVWPNLIEVAVDRGVPVVVIGGRISDRSAPRYQRLSRFLRGSFEHLTEVGAQTDAYARRFEQLGVPPDRVQVTGSLKWDAIQVRDSVPGAEQLASELGIDPRLPLVVAGSTGPGEEALLVEDWPSDVQLLVAPRKPERFEQAAQALGGPVRRSAPGGGRSGRFLLDSMGELDAAYSLADVAIVGRSFNGQGGSNPIEPASVGCAVVVGPDHQNFRDSVETLLGVGGVAVTRPREVVAYACHLARHPLEREAMVQAAQAVIRRRTGATDRTVALIEGVLAGP